MLHGSKESALNQVKVKVSRNPDNHGLLLIIEPPLLKQYLFLNKQGQFDLAKIKSSQEGLGGAIKSLSLDGITLTIPGVEGSIILRPDGSLTIEGMNSPSSVALSTPGSIEINGPVQTNALTIKAQKIDINHSVIAKDALIIQVAESLQNNQTLEAKNIKILGSGQFKNFGIVSATESLKIGIRAVNNYGNILANDIRAHVKPSKIATDDDKTKALQIYFNNEGVLLGKGHLSLKINGKIMNQGSGEILSSGRVNIQSMSSSFNNTAKVYSKEKLIVSGRKHIINSGILTAEKFVEIVSAETVHNAGIVQSFQGMYVSGRHTLDNRAQGVFIAETTLNLYGNKAFCNAGIMEGKQSVVINAKSLIRNKKTGKILSNVTVELQGLRELKNNGEITGHLSVKTQTVGDTCNGNHAQISGEALFLSTLGELNNKGKITADEFLKLQAGVARNAGGVHGKYLSLNAGSLINEVCTGEISSLEALTLKVKMQLMNAHNITSAGDLLINAMLEFINSADGSVTAENLTARANVVRNNGLLKASKNLRLEAKLILDNLLKGLILAGEKLDLFSKAILENAGNIASKGALLLKSDQILKNLSAGHVVADEDLQLLAGHVLSNAGHLSGNKDVLVKSEHWFTNLLGAALRSEGALKVKVAYQVENEGVLSAKEKLIFKALKVLRNHQSGELKAEGTLSAVADIVDNWGLIDSEDTLTVETRLILTNYREGRLNAKEAMALCSACIVRNAGSIKSSGDITLKAEILLQILADGNIETETQLALLSQFAIENAGLLRAEHIRTESQFLVNHGTMTSLKTLSIKVQEIFQHCREGRLEAQEAIVILAKDLQMVGQLMAAGDFTATIDRNFDYNPETLWASGLLKLMLKQGYDFTKPINTAGSLTVQSDLDIQVHAPIQAGKAVEVNARNLGVKSGGIFAGETLKSTVAGTTQLEPGTYVASNAEMSLNAGVIRNNLAEIYTGEDLILHALSLIENSGNMTVGGSAQIIAALFHHHLLTRSHAMGAEALSAKPTLTVSKDCTIQGNTKILGGVLHAGGHLIAQGNFEAHSFEAFRNWYEYYLEKGKRKGLWRGHHYHQRGVLRHQTLAVYDSQVSAGVVVNTTGSRFSNGGAFRTPHANIQFTEFQNGNHLRPTTESSATKIPLAPFFKESALFGRSKDDSYVYGPKLPLRLNLDLSPPVQVGLSNPIAEALFAPIIEKDLLQQALHQEIRSGFVDNQAGSPEAVLAQLRQNAYDLFQSRHPGLAAEAGVPSITEQDLALSEKAFLYYRQRAPFFHLPTSVRQKIAMGNNHEAVFRAEQAVLDGGVGSTARITGRAEVDNTCEVRADTLIIEQRTETHTSIVKKSRKDGNVAVDTVQTVVGTGVLKAGKFEGSCHRYEQIGGVLHSGTGGTRLVVRDEALIKALRGTEVHQGPISRRGTNYEIEPYFVPASITTDGSQTVIVTNGPLIAEGMRSIAHGANTLQAQQGVFIRNVKAAYDLPSTRSHKQSTGGSNFVSLTSVVQGHTILIESAEAFVKIINTQLYAMGDVTVKAKTVVELLNDIGETSVYTHTRKTRGFHHVNQKTDRSQTHVLQTELAILGNLIIFAEAEIRLKAVRGFIAGDMSLEARNVILEGAVEQERLRAKTKTTGLSFFGSAALENMMQGKNTRAVFKSLCGEDRFLAALQQLAEAKDGSDTLIASVETFVEGWRLATLVAHACQETAPDGTEGDVIGSLTDRWGITTPIKDESNKLTGREFNPKFTLSHCRSEIIQEFTRTIPTTLMINGDLHIVADVVKLLDGTQIEAQNISIYARRLLEIQAAENTQHTRSSQKSASVSFRLDGTVDSIGASGANHRSDSAQYANAILKARNLLNILVDGKMVLKGVALEAHDVAIRAVKMIVESLQDIHDESGKSWGVTVGSDGQPTSVQSGSTEAHQRWTHNPTQIRAEQSLTLFTDYLLQKGSILSAGERLRVHGLNQENPQSWAYEDIQEVLTSHSTQIGLSFNGRKDSFPLTGFAKFKRAEKTGVTHATVAALDLAGDMPVGINRDLNRTQQVLSDKKSSVGIPIVVPNFDKLAEDTKTIGEALVLLHTRVEPKLEPDLPEELPDVETPIHEAEKSPRKWSSQPMERDSQSLSDRLSNVTNSLAVLALLENNKTASRNETVPIFSLNFNLPLLPQEVVDAAAGFGDGLSFGVTQWVREKLDIDGVVNKNSDAYNVSLLAGMAMPYSVYGKAASFAVAGREIELGKNLNIALFGNRTGHPTGVWPHYHRRHHIPETGRVKRDQGFPRHRPWDSRETDKSFWDKF